MVAKPRNVSATARRPGAAPPIASDSKAAGGLLRAALAVAALSPLAYAFWFRYSTVARFDVPRFAAMSAVLALMCAWLMFGGSLREAREHAGQWALALACVAGVAVVSALVSGQAAQSLTYGAERSFMSAPVWIASCLTAFVVSLPSARRNHRLVISILVVGAAAFVAAGAYERLRYDKFSGMLGNGNFVGAMVVTALPLSLLMLKASGTRARPVWWIAFAMLLAGVALSQSVTAIAVLVTQVIAITVLAPEIVVGHGGSGQRTLRWGVGACVTLLLAVLLAWVVAPGVLPPQVRGTLDEQLAGPTFESRMSSWSVAWSIFLDRPLLGAGPDGLDRASQPFLSARYITRNHPGDTGVVALMRDPHNLVLLGAASIGLLGLAAIGWLAWVWGREVVDGYRAASGRRKESVFLLSLATVSFVGSMMLVPWSVRYAAAPALVAGMAFSAARGTLGDRSRRPAPLAFGQVGAIRILLAATAGASVLLGVTLWASQSAIARSEIAFDVTTAQSLARSATRLTPTRLAAWSAYVDTSGEMMQSGLLSPEQFIAIHDSAPSAFTAYAPYEAMTARHCFDYVNRFRGPERLAAFGAAASDRAITAAPGLPEAQVQAARAAIYRGDAARATQLLRQAEDLGFDPRMIAEVRSQIQPAKP